MQPQTGALHQLLSNCIEEWYGSESKMLKQSSEYIKCSDIVADIKFIKDQLNILNKLN
jgi:hypothetical protein